MIDNFWVAANLQFFPHYEGLVAFDGKAVQANQIPEHVCHYPIWKS